MATIGQLNVKLVTSVGKFVRGLDKGASAVSRLGSRVASVATGPMKWLGAAGAAAVVALAALTVQGLKSADSLGKVSDQLGVSTEDLAGFRLGAELTGASAEQLDKALTTMLKNIGDAANGTGEAIVALDQLGISADELVNLSTADQLRAIADAISKIPNPAQRASIAMKLFGDSGAILLNFLKDGSEGIDAFVAEADRLGLSISRVDAAQVEAANDAITRMKSVIKGVGLQLAVNLAPYIQAVADRFVAMATSGRSTGDIVINAIEGIARGAAFLADGVKIIQQAWLGLKIIVLAVAAAIIEAVNLIVKGFAYLADLIPGVGDAIGDFSEDLDLFSESFSDELGAAVDELEELGNKSYSDGVKSLFDDIRKSARSAAEEITNTTDALGDFKPAPDLDAQLEQLRDLENLAKRVYEQTRTPAEAYAAEVEDLNKLLEAGLIDQETFDRAIARAIEARDAALGQSESKPSDPGRFTEIDPRLVSLTRGESRTQRDEQSAQIEESNRLLRRIADAVQGGVRIG